MNPNVHSISEHSSIRTIKQNRITPTKMSNTMASNKVMVGSDAVHITNNSNSVDLSISKIGLQKAQSINHRSASNSEEAKSLLEGIKDNIKANPEIVSEVHSNLRIIRINQLIYD
jgi:hypothetical protein